MAITFDVDADLRPFAPSIDAAKAEIMIADALAMAEAFAPCVFETGFTNESAAKAIIRAAILRWNDAGSGANSTLVAGPYTQVQPNDTARIQRGKFWPSEVTDLQNLCSGATNRQAFTVDTYPEANPSTDWDGTGIWPWVG